MNRYKLLLIGIVLAAGLGFAVQSHANSKELPDDPPSNGKQVQFDFDSAIEKCTNGDKDQQCTVEGAGEIVTVKLEKITPGSYRGSADVTQVIDGFKFTYVIEVIYHKAAGKIDIYGVKVTSTQDGTTEQPLYMTTHKFNNLSRVGLSFNKLKRNKATYQSFFKIGPYKH